MKRFFCISLVITIISTMIHFPLFAQSYDSLWKQVKDAEDKSLPQTMMETADKIFLKAQKEKNAPQMFKAYLFKARSQEEVTPDSIYPNFKFVEKWVKEEKNSVNRAVLHSILSGMYLDYLDRHSYQLRNRTELAEGEVPDDMREWTRGIFERKAQEHANAAIEDVPALLNTSAEQYRPFAILEKGSEYFAHDMYHLMATRTIDNLGELSNQRERMEEIYQQMMRTYQGMRGKEEAALLVTLDYWKWKGNADKDLYDSLISKYDRFPVVMEAYLLKAGMLKDADRPAEALKLIDQAVGKYPKYFRVNAFYDLKDDILSSYLSVNANKMLYPGEKTDLTIDFANQQSVDVKLYATNLQELPFDEVIKQETLAKLGLSGLKEWHFDLDCGEGENNKYLRHTNHFDIETPEKPGVYLLSVTPGGWSKQVCYRYLTVSRLKVLTLSLGDGNTEVVTLDRKTGQPIGGVEVTFFRGNGSNYLLLDKITTGEDGRKVFKSSAESYVSYVAKKGDDTAMLRQSVYLRNKEENHDTDTEYQLTLLTDRAIYRPGQTVYVKGIAYQQKDEDAKVIENRGYRLTLHDVNGKELSAVNVRTNDFGSFNTSFVLPTATLNGMFTIRAQGRENGSTRIRVEEYKRPTFEITFEPIREAYRIGDTVQLKGHVETFSGATVQNVPLNYRITGNYWRIWSSSEDPQAADSVMIDGKGDFVIPVTLKTNDSSNTLSITVEVSVTNEAGETQTASRSIWASQRAYSLGTDIPQYFKIEERTMNNVQSSIVNCQLSIVNFQCTNASGEEQQRDVRYRLFKVAREGTSFDEVKTQLPVDEGVVKGNEPHDFSRWKNLDPALYMLELTVVGEEELPEHQRAQHIASFYLYSDEDLHLQTFVNTFCDANGRGRMSFNAQQPASFIFGTSHERVFVMMDVFSDGKRLESKTLQLDNELCKFDIPYKEEYGDGVTVLFTFVKDDRVYEKTVMIEKSKPQRTLDIKWEVFRDKLQPGQQEEWKLVIKTPQGTPAAAEMLAYLYDASLDKIYSRYQYLNLYFGRRLYSASRSSSNNQTTYWSFYWKQKDYEVPGWSFDYLDVPRVRFDYMDGMVLLESRAVAPMAKGMATRVGGVANAMAEEDAEVAQMADTAETADEQEMIENEKTEQTDGNSQPVRSNFAETAFFYPQLRTNDKGEVVFSFTMPESLTRWNFRGITHTKDMMTGNISAQTVTQKDFMLRPNMPRFLRMGDQVNITAVISNLTDKPVQGTATFTLFDPITDKTIAVQSKPFSVEGKGNSSVSFGFDVAEEYSLVGVRMVADGGKFSDGEQHVLPVLSNKQYITETLAMPIRGNQTREFSMETLFNHQHPSATQKKLTVEFTGNPAWYAVQALPEISEPVSDNAIAWASAFYGNTLASFIANSQPRIQQVFNRWKQEGGDKETLLSQLEKNQELKEIILSETPWVMEANTETERKQRLGTLFDLNQMNDRINTDLTKLQGLQNADGGWSWFSGMESSFYTTTYITGLLIRLQMLLDEGTMNNEMMNNEERIKNNVQSSMFSNLKSRGFDFLHARMLEHYQRLLKNYGKDKLPKYLSYMEMQYLYLIAIGNISVPRQNQEAYNYFLSLVDTNLKDGDVISKAQSAIIQHKAGKMDSSEDFINSLKEHMVDEDEMGAHFAFLDKPYTWAMIPVPQHVAVMEALKYVGGHDELIEEMKMWLLKQKQTRGWNSSVCTVDAIYALLCRDANLLANKGDVRITFADRVMETISPTKSDTPDLGYIKESFTDQQTVSAPLITVEKRDDGIAWGAAYAQYFSPMTDIQQHGKELNLERRFYVERVAADGKKTLEQIGNGAKLKIGDVVVSRMTIELDRAMDFVQLKDRPASCFEPVTQLSGYRWNGVGYYQEVEDAATNFFFDMLGKGMHVLEVRYRVQRTGTYQVGASTVQSAYAPEFSSHSAGITINIED
ncbi:MAG: alpha-2-macroglobulin [Bacteroidaceae bacterium]|nr:alpha-2-macroglobulin [Bacteroidaceae bacterium]